MQARIRAIVDQAASELSGGKLTLSDDTILFGVGGEFESVELISFIVSIEDTVEDEFEVELGLAESDEIFAENGPLRTLGRFRHFVAEKLTAQRET